MFTPAIADPASNYESPPSATFVTTAVVPFHPRDHPADLAPNGAQGSMLRPMSVPDRRARAARLRIHRRDQPKETEHSNLTLKETRLNDPIKRAVPRRQPRGAFWLDPGSARQFVGRITPERNEVRHSVWINTISFPDLFGPDARYFPAPRRVQDRCARLGELKRIPIATRHKGRTATAFLCSNRSGEKVVGLEPWGFGVCKPACGDKFR